MTTLATFNVRNFDAVSGIAAPLSFPSYWQIKIIEERDRVLTESFSVDPVKNILSFLKNKNCEIVNEREVSNFLNINIDIISYLYEAPDIIFQYFGDVKLNLELFFDPETIDDEGELFLNIETDFDVKKAHEKLKEIDKEWFLDKVNKDIGKFNLNLEFI